MRPLICRWTTTDYGRRTTDDRRTDISLSLSLSIYIYMYIQVSFSLCIVFVYTYISTYLFIYLFIYSLTKRSFKGFLLSVNGGAMDPHPRRFPQFPPDSQSSPRFQFFKIPKVSPMFLYSEWYVSFYTPMFNLPLNFEFLMPIKLLFISYSFTISIF